MARIHLALTPHTEESLFFLCGVCMFSLCLHGFTPVSSHSTETSSWLETSNCLWNDGLCVWNHVQINAEILASSLKELKLVVLVWDLPPTSCFIWAILIQVARLHTWQHFILTCREVMKHPAVLTVLHQQEVAAGEERVWRVHSFLISLQTSDQHRSLPVQYIPLKLVHLMGNKHNCLYRGMLSKSHSFSFVLNMSGFEVCFMLLGTLFQPRAPKYLKEL